MQMVSSELNSQQVFEIIAEMIDELKNWDELNHPTDPAHKSGALSALEELSSRLRQKLLERGEPIVCACGLVIASPEVYEKHKSFCGVANR